LPNRKLPRVSDSEITGLVCEGAFKHNSERTLYVAGDTVWYDAVQEVIDTHNPEVIVVNAGDNHFNEGGSLLMGKSDVPDA